MSRVQIGRSHRLTTLSSPEALDTGWSDAIPVATGIRARTVGGATYIQGEWCDAVITLANVANSPTTLTVRWSGTEANDAPLMPEASATLAIGVDTTTVATAHFASTGFGSLFPCEVDANGEAVVYLFAKVSGGGGTETANLTSVTVSFVE
ncbi:MAG: hypothetical protein H6733_07890 [Alphaproteobacteria bacterium]|nr:hypothetical protein [Alphaproteobacteria bacterium]